MGWTPEARRRKYIETMTAMSWAKRYQYVLKEFQKLRRLEEADTNGVVQCISCDARPHWKVANGGHFIRSGNRGVCFHDHNVWPQCVACNQHRSGNESEYRKRLVLVIGEAQVELLEAEANRQQYYRHSIEELADLKLEFVDRLNEFSF